MVNEKRRWTPNDPTIYFCNICGKWHYKNSKIGENHRKYNKEGEEKK